jgi:hypothetical protein
MPQKRSTATKKTKPAHKTTTKRTKQSTTPKAPAGYLLMPLALAPALGLAHRAGVVSGLLPGYRLTNDAQDKSAIEPAQAGTALERFQAQVQALNAELAQAREQGQELAPGGSILPQKSLGDPARERPLWVQPWLAAIAKTGINTAACRAAGIHPSTPWHYLKDNPDFQEEWDNARLIAKEALLVEARRRAVEGTMRPIVQKGELVGYENVYSDNLLLALLKSEFPQFADRYVVHLEHSELFILTQNGYTVDQALRLLIDELSKPDAPALAQGAVPVLALGAGSDNSESESDN